MSRRGQEGGRKEQEPGNDRPAKELGTAKKRAAKKSAPRKAVASTQKNDQADGEAEQSTKQQEAGALAKAASAGHRASRAGAGGAQRTILSETKIELARRLRVARRRSGLSQRDVYGVTGIARRTLQAYENARHFPGAWALAELARIYAVSADWLLQLE